MFVGIVGVWTVGNVCLWVLLVCNSTCPYFDTIMYCKKKINLRYFMIPTAHVHVVVPGHTKRKFISQLFIPCCVTMKINSWIWSYLFLIFVSDLSNSLIALQIVKWKKNREVTNREVNNELKGDSVNPFGHWMYRLTVSPTSFCACAVWILNVFFELIVSSEYIL